MSQPKESHKPETWDGARSVLSPLTFVRAAALANLLVATLVFAEFTAIAVVKHEDKAFEMGLWLVPFVTLVVWSTAAVLGFLALAPMRLWNHGRRLVGRVRSSRSAKSGVWDDWLDSPKAHDR